MAASPSTAAARPTRVITDTRPRVQLLDFERVAGAQGEIDRIDRKRAQEKRQRFEDGPDHQENSFS